jgi:hypothetical protein
MTRFGVFFLCIVAIGIVALPLRAIENPKDGNKAKDDKESKTPLVITVLLPSISQGDMGKRHLMNRTWND